MRAHGLPGFPDPNSEGAFDSSRFDENSPAFQTASNACKSLQPTGPHRWCPEAPVTMQQADFACYAAHELRTPRRPSAHCSSWPSPTRTPIWRAGARSARTSSGACRHQERLLDACLALARGRGGLQSSEAVDLAEIAADALRTHDPGALTRVAQLCPAATSGDPVLLERLAANLISNAIRHNVAGGRLAVATRMDQGCAVLSIANTGVRVPAGEVDRLFQPFRRLGAAAGVGLGLAIVREVADAHDAVIAARAPVSGGLDINVVFAALAPSRRGRASIGELNLSRVSRAKAEGSLILNPTWRRTSTVARAWHTEHFGTQILLNDAP